MDNATVFLQFLLVAVMFGMLITFWFVIGSVYFITKKLTRKAKKYVHMVTAMSDSPIVLINPKKF